MEITTSLDLPATPDQAYAVLTDETFHDAKCAETSTGSYTVTITPQPGQRDQGAVVRTSRELPTDDLPDVVKGFVGSTLTVIEVITWGAAAADGSRAGAVELTIEGAPLSMRGTVTLTSTATGSREDFRGDLKAKVPFIGGKVEQAAAGPIRAAIDIETRMLAERLAAQS